MVGALVNYLGQNITLDDYAARRFPSLPESRHRPGPRDVFNRLINQRSGSPARLTRKSPHASLPRPMRTTWKCGCGTPGTSS